MKGTVVVCLKEMIHKRVGRDAWEKILAAAKRYDIEVDEDSKVAHPVR